MKIYVVTANPYMGDDYSEPLKAFPGLAEAREWIADNSHDLSHPIITEIEFDADITLVLEVRLEPASPVF